MAAQETWNGGHQPEPGKMLASGTLWNRLHAAKNLSRGAEKCPPQTPNAKP